MPALSMPVFERARSWDQPPFQPGSDDGFEQERVNSNFLFCQISGASECGTLKTR